MLDFLLLLLLHLLLLLLLHLLLYTGLPPSPLQMLSLSFPLCLLFFLVAAVDVSKIPSAPPTALRPTSLLLLAPVEALSAEPYSLSQFLPLFFDSRRFVPEDTRRPRHSSPPFRGKLLPSLGNDCHAKYSIMAPEGTSCSRERPRKRRGSGFFPRAICHNFQPISHSAFIISYLLRWISFFFSSSYTSHLPRLPASSVQPRKSLRQSAPLAASCESPARSSN